LEQVYVPEQTRALGPACVTVRAWAQELAFVPERLLALDQVWAQEQVCLSVKAKVPAD
jgi:hypothetical protein